MNTDTETQTGRGKLISAQELMAELSIGRTWLHALMKEGMPFVCLNPNTPHPKLRRYRYDLQAVMEWLAARTAEQKGVEA